MTTLRRMGINSSLLKPESRANSSSSHVVTHALPVGTVVFAAMVFSIGHRVHRVDGEGDVASELLDVLRPRVVSQSQLRDHVGITACRPHCTEEAARPGVLEQVHDAARGVEDLVARAVLRAVGHLAVGLRAVEVGAVHVGHIGLGDGDVGHGVVEHGPDLHRVVVGRDSEARVPEHGALDESRQVVEADVEPTEARGHCTRDGRELERVARVAGLVADVELLRDVRVGAVEGEGRVGWQRPGGGRGLRLEAAEPARAKLPLKPQVVRIEVLGDEKVGKTSLICSLVSRHFSEKVPSVLLNVQIPAEESDENVIISITDTSSAAALAGLHRQEQGDPRRASRQQGGHQRRHPHDGRPLREPSATPRQHVSVCGVGGGMLGEEFHAGGAGFLLGAESGALSRGAALQREETGALRLCGILSRDELNEYQYDCFGVRLLSTEIDTLMEYLSSEVPSGVAPDRSGLFVDGFIYLWWLFIDRNRPESGWQVLRSLGYNNDLHLEIPPERLQLPPYEEDQSAQLTPQTVEFLTNLFRQFDANKDNNIAENEVEAIFSICEDESAPWTTCSAISSPLLYERTMVDGKPTLSLAVWLACWSFVAQENPQKLLETLFYLGYNDKLFPAIEFVKSRSLTRKAMRIDRNVISCYIFGSPDSGKEHFLHTFVGDKEAPLTDDEQFILRGIGAVPDRDTTKYLFITDALSDDEIEMKADVLLLVLNPEDEPSKVFVEELDKKLPASIPRVVISYKLEKQDDDVEEGKVDESSALVKEEPIDFAIDATLKQYPTALKCYEAHSVKDEVARVLVATALRPPKNARSKSSGIWLPGRKTGMGVIGLTAAAAVVAFVAKPEESKAVVNDIRLESVYAKATSGRIGLLLRSGELMSLGLLQCMLKWHDYRSDPGNGCPRSEKPNAVSHRWLVD
ncbi:hypothetical protein ON010_g7997 [Phytophthora cinnamomi]|nr:hypothetical protein ON010_g7997 [Phytophthora cinnamomi]